ncbi:MAG: MFS transporter [Pseudomonadota bacterium]
MNRIETKPTGFSNWKALLLYGIVSLFLFFEMAVQVSPSVMSGQLMHDLNLGAFSLGIMSGIYFYSYTAMQIPSGFLFDKYNPRLVITFSILVCVLGTVLFAGAQNVYTGSLARLLMGSGSAFAFVAVLVVTADLFKAKYFATMTGITQMLAAFGAMAGQLPISILLAHIGWRHTLLVLAVIGTLLAILVWKLLKYERKNLAVVSHSSVVPTRSNLKKILGRSQTWFIALYACLLWVPMSSVASLWGVPFLTSVDHVSPTSAAFLCSLMWLGLAVASPLLGIISTAMGKRVSPLAISALIGAIAFGLFLEFNFSPAVLGILLFFSGVACSGQALSFTLVKENNAHEVKATALAFNNMAVVISGAFFQPLIGKLIDAGQTSMPGVYAAASFKNGLLIVLCAYVVAFAVATFLIKEPQG